MAYTLFVEQYQQYGVYFIQHKRFIMNDTVKIHVSESIRTKVITKLLIKIKNS